MSIEKLTATIVGLGATDAMRIRLEVTYVCHVVKCKSHMLIDDDSKIWIELEGCVNCHGLGFGTLKTLMQMRMMEAQHTL